MALVRVSLMPRVPIQALSGMVEWGDDGLLVTAKGDIEYDNVIIEISFTRRDR